MGFRVGVDPTEWRTAVAKRIDEHQDAMQLLITALDQTDVDPELEPYLAGFETVTSDDTESDPAESEPTLGWTLATLQDGRKWLAKCRWRGRARGRPRWAGA
jgi:hypothetical protein